MRPNYLGPRVWFTPNLIGPTGIMQTVLRGWIPPKQRITFEMACEAKRLAMVKAGKPVGGW